MYKIYVDGLFVRKIESKDDAISWAKKKKVSLSGMVITNSYDHILHTLRNQRGLVSIFY